MDPPFTLPFDRFWQWVVLHANCILRAGTTEAAIFDDEDLHWHFGTETDGIVLVQLIRGKRLYGELYIDSERIDYVQAVPTDNEGEFVFELISENEEGRIPSYFFVLVHAYDEEDTQGSRKVH